MIAFHPQNFGRVLDDKSTSVREGNCRQGVVVYKKRSGQYVHRGDPRIIPPQRNRPFISNGQNDIVSQTTYWACGQDGEDGGGGGQTTDRFL